MELKRPSPIRPRLCNYAIVIPRQQHDSHTGHRADDAHLTGCGLDYLAGNDRRSWIAWSVLLVASARSRERTRRAGSGRSDVERSRWNPGNSPGGANPNYPSVEALRRHFDGVETGRQAREPELPNAICSLSLDIVVPCALERNLCVRYHRAGLVDNGSDDPDGVLSVQPSWRNQDGGESNGNKSSQKTSHGCSDRIVKPAVPFAEVTCYSGNQRNDEGSGCDPACRA